MAVDYTTTELLANAKRRCTAPTSAQIYSTAADFVAVANEELRSTVVPDLKSAQQRFFEETYDVAVTAGTTSYPLPGTSVGASLSNVEFVSGASHYPVAQIDPAKLYLYEYQPGVLQPYGSGGFYLRGNQVVLYPAPNQNATMRLTFAKRRNILVVTTEAAVVASVNSGTNQLTLTAPPAALTTVGAIIDVVKGTPEFDLRTEAATVSAAAGSVITIPSVSGIVAGDWVALTGYSPIPMLPPEVHDLLAQAVAARFLLSIGVEGANTAVALYGSMRDRLLQTFTPRVQNQPIKIVSSRGVW